MLKKILTIAKNKYFLITSIFVVWVIFFDKSNFITQIDLSKKLRQLKEDKRYYQMEIKTDSIKTYKLLNDPESLEKFSRERYNAKRDSEDIFIIVPEDTSVAIKN